MVITVTLVIVIVTALISIGAFSQQRIEDDLIFYPPAISQRKQYYRFITHGFIHPDVVHLAFNMIALYSFGEALESVFRIECVFGNTASIIYLVLYFTSLIVASLPDYIRYRDSYHFKSLGASGAVSAVAFATILFFPQMSVGLIFIPGVRVPGWIFAILYLGISAYLDRRGGGRVNHSAHFWGSAYGVVFTIIACMLLAKNFNIYENFMTQIRSKSEMSVLLCQ